MITMNLELLADIGPVSLHGAVADEELVGDLATRFVFRDQLQDAPLGGRKIFQLRFLLTERYGATMAVEQKTSQRGADIILSGCNRSHAIDYVRQSAVFEHVTFGA